jgi:hypothetical protein
MRRLDAVSRPTPGVIVAALALVAAVAGTALAADPVESTSAVSKKKVKKIAAKQVNKLAPGLSVAHASTADSATTADSANTANTADSAKTANSAIVGGPVAFGLVDCSGGADCEVVSAQSRGLTDAMVAIGGGLGTACFNVPFTFRGAQVTPDLQEAGNDASAQYSRGGGGPCSAPSDARVSVREGGGLVDSGFHIEFYR